MYATIRFQKTDALIERYIEDNRMSMVTIPYGDTGIVRAFPQAQGESIEDWAERVKSLNDSTGEIDAKKYKCGELTGCSVGGNGKITVCIFIGTLTPEQVNEELEEALDAFCEQFLCAECN